MTTVSHTVQAEGYTLGRLIWKFLGRQPEGYIEQVYEANQNLAALATELPVGTVVKFPLDNIPDDTAVQQAVRLWD